jgi:hypothetical protein
MSPLSHIRTTPDQQDRPIRQTSVGDDAGDGAGCSTRSVFAGLVLSLAVARPIAKAETVSRMITNTVATA